MVFIVSNEKDYSTNVIIKYLILNNFSYVRLTERQFVKSIRIEVSNTNLTNIIFEINGQLIHYDDISSFWFRKNKIELFNDLELNCPSGYSVNHTAHLKKFIINEELSSIREFLIYMLEKKRFLGKYSVGNGNKFISFVKAAESGLKIPHSILSTKTEELRIFSSGIDVIAKPVEEGYYFNSEEYFFYSKNELFDNSKFGLFEENIAPSVVQEYIGKKIELRIFYLSGNCYSMAIFSQSDSKTRIDFRNYNDDNPNRMVPYKLPVSIEENIQVFMKKMNLKSGSIDMILTSNNDYVFLEVNPVGQYGMVSENCNYPLDKLISIELTKL